MRKPIPQQGQKIGVGLFGENGHQIAAQLMHDARFQLVAHARMSPRSLPPAVLQSRSIAKVENLGELLANPAVQLVSLCSPRRADQAAQAMECLRAGRHVLAEKPCAMTLPDLDRLIDTAVTTGLVFREMANDIGWRQPYLAMRRAVESGRLGRVIQVLAQKSYPMHSGRSDDEDVDGGLLLQCASHTLRMIEQVAGLPIESIDAIEATGAENVSGLRIAASMMMRLGNGALGTAVANYLNPGGFGLWGNEHLRVFGTHGMAEITDGGQHSRLYTASGDAGPLQQAEPDKDQLELLAEEIVGGISRQALELQLHPTRMAILARNAARAQ